ncbi:hypothetical protein GC177_09030 [bacterium]|nr:hypothetical protein [bacterium]
MSKTGRNGNKNSMKRHNKTIFFTALFSFFSVQTYCFAADLPHNGRDVLHQGRDVVHEGRDVLQEGKDVVQDGASVVPELPKRPCHSALHKPKDGTMYEAGKTAEGWQVSSPYAPGTEPMEMDAKDVTIPLQKNLNDAYPIHNKHLDKNLTAIQLGTVTFDENGQLNGKSLNDAANAANEPCSEE